MQTDGIFTVILRLNFGAAVVSLLLSFYFHFRLAFFSRVARKRMYLIFVTYIDSNVAFMFM